MSKKPVDTVEIAELCVDSAEVGINTTEPMTSVTCIIFHERPPKSDFLTRTGMATEGAS